MRPPHQTTSCTPTAATVSAPSSAVWTKRTADPRSRWAASKRALAGHLSTAVTAVAPASSARKLQAPSMAHMQPMSAKLRRGA